MNGSSNFRRTQDFNPGVEETETGEEVMLAFTYEDIGNGQVKITGYRNDETIGSYNSEISEHGLQEMLKSYLVKDMEPQCLMDPEL